MDVFYAGHADLDIGDEEAVRRFFQEHEVEAVVSCAADRTGHGHYRYPTEDGDIKAELTRNCALLHPAAMIRANIIRERHILYEEEFSPAEDHALWCRLLPHTQFHNLPETLFLYRSSYRNTTARQKEKMNAARLRITSLMAREHPDLCRDFAIRAAHIRYVRLFDFLPLLKIVRRDNRTKVYLFDKIPLLTLRGAEHLL